MPNRYVRLSSGTALDLSAVRGYSMHNNTLVVAFAGVEEAAIHHDDNATALPASTAGEARCPTCDCGKTMEACGATEDCSGQSMPPGGGVVVAKGTYRADYGIVESATAALALFNPSPGRIAAARLDGKQVEVIVREVES